MRIVFYVPDAYFPPDTPSAAIVALRTRMGEAMRAAYPMATCVVSAHACPEASTPDEFRRVGALVVSDDPADASGLTPACFDLWHVVVGAGCGPADIVNWESSYRSAQARYERLEGLVRSLVRDGCSFYAGHPDFDALLSFLRNN